MPRLCKLKEKHVYSFILIHGKSHKYLRAIWVINLQCTCTLILHWLFRYLNFLMFILQRKPALMARSLPQPPLHVNLHALATVQIPTRKHAHWLNRKCVFVQGARSWMGTDVCTRHNADARMAQKDTLHTTR